MEPMMMGSPVIQSSPGTGQSQFLPAYLMGDPAPAAQTNQRMWTSAGTSPPRSSVNRSSNWLSPQGPGQMQQANTTNNLFLQSPRSDSRARDMMGGRPKEKPGAPPVQGLLESIHNSTLGHESRVDGDMSAMGGHLGTSMYATPGITSTPSMFSPGGNQSQMMSRTRKTPPSPAQVDPFYTQGESLRAEDDLDDTWVTIFGFPPAATSYILQQFSQYGNIIKHVISPDGNWMHLHFQSKFQAKKALSKNGKIFGNSIMVGVTPCIDKRVLEGEKEVSMVELRSSYLGTPTQHQLNTADKSLASASGPIRSLTSAYKAASSDHEVLQKTHTPQKNSNIVSKAMDYMFGW